MNKDFFLTLAGVALAVFIGVFIATRVPGNKLGDSGFPLIFNAPTQATSSVGTGLPSNILARFGGRQMATVCNTSPTTTNDLMLELDATSSIVGLNAPGILVPGNSCYDFRQANLFVGDIYATFTTNTATVSTLYR